MTWLHVEQVIEEMPVAPEFGYILGIALAALIALVIIAIIDGGF